MQNIRFSNTERNYISSHNYNSNLDLSLVLPTNSESALTIIPIGIMLNDNICFKISDFFHSVYFRKRMISTICHEIIRDSNIWDYVFKLYIQGSYVVVNYNLKLKDITLDKFKKYKSCDIYFDTLYRQLETNDINIKDKSYIPENNPYNLPINTSVALFSYQLKNIQKMISIEDQGIEKTIEITIKIPDQFIKDKPVYYDPIKKTISYEKDYVKIKSKGGILADHMGLGKTLTTLSLISINKAKNDFLNKPQDLIPTKSTLLVCPSQLCKQWKDEVKKNFPYMKVVMILTKTNHIKVSYQDIIDADIVIVSYQFLINFNYYPSLNYEKTTPAMVKISSRQKSLDNYLKKLKESNTKEGVTNYSKCKAPMLENFYWHRLVMDEAHEIFGYMLSNKSQNHYLCNWINLLNYTNRWFVSGTPFVNKSGYTSCLNYLELEFFYQDIKVNTKVRNNILENVESKNYVIDQILSHICIRHLKEDVENEIKLLGYQEQVYWINMLDIERGIYNSHKNKPRRILQQLCCHPLIAEHIRSNSYAEIDFDKIKEDLLKNNTIRKFNYETKLKNLEKRFTTSNSSNPEYAMLKSKYTSIVMECNYMIKVLTNISKIKEGEIELKDNCSICLDKINNPVVTPCGHMFCSDCLKQCLNFQKKCPECRNSLKDKEIYSISAKNNNSDDSNNPLIDKYGSKLGKLISICRILIANKNNRIIIFSQWESMLTLVGKSLADNGVNNAFVKGNVWCRNKSISKFKKGNDTKVIMLSLNNSASGTNLIEATHVIFIEPVDSDYNTIKAIEGQAIGRACRLGQNKKVKVIRILTRGTIEEEIFKNYDKNYIKPNLIEVEVDV